MCSSGGGQLARICRAIEELADRPVAGGSAAAVVAAESGQVMASESGDVVAGDDLAAWLARLAAIWAMVAEADPELARRLPGYLAAPEQADG
jgi:hypothetical protein